MRDIRRDTRRHYSAEDTIRIVLEALRGEDRIAALRRREGIAKSLYCAWSKESSKLVSATSPATRPGQRPSMR